MFTRHNNDCILVKGSLVGPRCLDVPHGDENVENSVTHVAVHHKVDGCLEPHSSRAAPLQCKGAKLFLSMSIWISIGDNRRFMIPTFGSLACQIVTLGISDSFSRII